MLGIEKADGTVLLKLDEDEANEGRVVYRHVGTYDQEALPYATAARLGKLHGEGTYLVIDCTYSSKMAKEIRVVMDEPTFSEYEEPEPDEVPTDPIHAV